MRKIVEKKLLKEKEYKRKENSQDIWRFSDFLMF
jgi:hypothetical protein